MTSLEAPIVCVLSNARSGSTALRSALAGSGRLKDFGEIFHNDRSLTPLPFLDFLERWRNPLLAAFDWNECAAISQAYLQQLRFESFNQQPLIDIKHNAWNVLRPLWQFPHDQPLFLTALKSARAIFVQLKRENLAEQIISYMIATDTNLWHSQVTIADIPGHLIGRRLDPILFEKLCRLFERAEAQTEEFLLGYSSRLTLTYEETFANGVLTRDAAERLGARVGVEIRQAALSLQPNSISKREIIANYDELCEIAQAIKLKRIKA